MGSKLPILIALVLGVVLVFVAALSQRHRHAAIAPEDRTALAERCDDGDAESCYELGLKWGNGEDGPADPTRAREYVSEACDLGSTEACGFLPMMK